MSLVRGIEMSVAPAFGVGRRADFRGSHPSLPYPIILFNAASASTEFSATTIAPQPDEY